MKSPDRELVAQTSHDSEPPLLDVHELSVAINGVPLLADVSFSVGAGEVVGLVGESGSGKTLTGLTLMGLLPNAATVTGAVHFDGVDILGASDARLRGLRGAGIGMIFQEPRASLHPSRPVGKQIVDVSRAHEEITVAAAQERARDMLGRVGLPNPRRTMSAYTHELSGGMCQRVMIAMALICEPRLLIADEPTTALDVTIQAQVIALLHDLAADRDLSVVLISHNLGVVSDLCTRMVTMYCGQVVNDDDTDRLLRRPQHPYPWALLQAATIDIEERRGWTGISGTPANPARPPAGCRFHPRCPYSTDACVSHGPPLVPAPGGGRTRCSRITDLELTGVAS